jgi:GABA permease
MTWQRSFLVVANVTAASDELIEALKARAPASFTLIIPATPFGGGREAAEAKLTEALEQLRAAGVEADGSVGDADPCLAVTDVWDPKRYDEIIVSTLPMRFSQWLRAGLPERIGKLTDAPVTHVVSQPPRPEPETAPPPAHPDNGMGPLSVLAWGARKGH